jgi:chitodextrinase
MTWSAWILATANPADDGQIISKSNGAGWQFKTSPDTGPHTFGIGVSSNSTSITQRYSQTVRALNTWYFVTGVYNAAARTLDIYVNGVLDNGTLIGTVPASQFNSSVNVNIGRRSGGSGYYFSGIIDEIRIYNRALSAAEIVADMNTPVGAAADTQPPTTPASLTATAASGSQINLSWPASTDNIAVTGYRVERCQNAGCSNFAQVATPAATTYNDTGLTAGTSYTYRVRAADAAGNLSPYSSVATATTLAPDTQPPTAPANLTATAAGGTGVTLGWTAATDNVGVTGYLVERCPGAGCSTFAQVGTTAAVAFSDTGLTSGTSYSYRVRAADAAGNLGAFSNVATASTADTQAPTAPSSLSAVAAGVSQINLSWIAATDNVGVTGYRVERCQGAGCSTFAQVATPAAAAYNDTALTAGTSYSYRVRATDAAGNLSAFSNVATTTTATAPDAQPPTAPSNLTATAAGGTGMTLGWTAATDNVAVTGYLVERCLGAGCSTFAQVGTTATTAFSDSGLTSGTSYSYRVQATDAAGNLGPYSNVATATTPTLDTQPPAAPSNLTATAAGSTGMTLGWTAATDNVAVTGYLVERCLGAGCSTFAQVGTTATTAFSDSGLTSGTSYSYRVRANDAAGNLSPYSNVASVSTPDTQAPTAPSNLTAVAAGGTGMTLGWTAATDNVAVTGYLVERCLGAGCSTFAQVGTTATTAFSDSGLTSGTSYSYRVRANDAAGNLSTFSNVASASTPDTQAPTAPSNLTAVAAGGSQVNLSWTAATDNIGVTGYRVERCQGAACTGFVQIATPAGTSYSDPGLTGNTSYSYQVRAVDAAGNLSGYSNTASVTTPAVVSGLAAAYGFNEGAGTTTADASGNAITGTLLNTTWTTSGKYSKALSFNGTTSYVDLGNPTALRLTGSATWSAWVFATGTPGDDGQIISKSGDSDGWQLKTTPDTGVRTFGITISNGSSSVQRNSQTVVALNTWYHVAGVYNAAAQTLNIYVNGVLDNGILTGTVPAAQNNSTVNVNIGRRTGGFYFIGTIDEVRVYNRALSQVEIQSDMNTSVGNTSVGPAIPSISACDLVAPFGTIDTADVTAAQNMALGLAPCTATVAVPQVCNVVVVQRVVNAMPPPNGTGNCAAGLGAVPHTARVSWTPTTTPNATYNVYRATTSGGYSAPLVSLPAGTTTYSDTSVLAGQTYFYVVRAVDPSNSSNVSSPTNEITAAIPNT